ncbi:MAG: HD domain-containing protein [Eubacterium sp.]|nr:HD domain-containing protein [Eubacterium sp.]
MITYYFGFLLVLSILILLYMAGKSYENINIYYWTIVLLVPIILLGYWLKTLVTTVNAALITMCYIYLDSTVLLMVILFSILFFLNIRVNPILKIIAYGCAFGHMFLIWLCVDNDLYYKSVTLINTSFGTITKMESGPLKIIHWIYIVAAILAISITLIAAWFRHGTFSRKTLITYSAFTAVGIVLYIIESLVDIDFSLLPTLYVVADLAVALNYDTAYSHDITGLVSRQRAENSTHGYAALSLNGQFLSCTRKAYDFFPELQLQIVDTKLVEGTTVATILYGLLEDYNQNNVTTKKFQVGELTCECEISTFTVHKRKKVLGYFFEIRDITEEEKVFKVMKDYNDTLNAEVNAKTDHIKGIQEKVVVGLANMIDNRDSNTGGHVKRTSDVIKILVEEIQKQGLYNIDDQMANDIIRSAPMHDLGKITIDNSILCKPGKLTDEEYAIMKTHAPKSGEFVHIILDDVEEDHFVQVAYNVARYHHERWDGKGYPEGLVGEMIPLEARIMAVADVYDALISDRCYRKAMSVPEVTEIMTENMGSQFDPNMYSVFLGCKDKMEKYYRG